MLTIEEKDRFVEILFLQYFNNKSSKILGKAEFWNIITNICNLYNIDNIAISKSVRILLAEENIPTEEESFYLLDKAGLTVRPINKITGIYWQKQVSFRNDFNNGKIPTIKRRITDIVIKKSLRDFINAIYDVFGIFKYVDKKILEDVIDF